VNSLALSIQRKLSKRQRVQRILHLEQATQAQSAHTVVIARAPSVHIPPGSVNQDVEYFNQSTTFVNKLE
jgi:hypothetical protein